MTLTQNGSSEFENGVGSHSSIDKLSTRLIHVGSKPDAATGAVIPAISLSTTYAQSDVGVHKGFEYSRSLNPNRLDLETVVASLEGVHDLIETESLPLPHALAFSSGSAATATVISALLGKGDHLISLADVYGGTRRYMTQVAAHLGVDLTFSDLFLSQEQEEDKEPAEGLELIISTLTSALRPGETKMIWIETPSNPMLRLVDIRLVSAFARKHNLTLVVDNTFMSPVYQQPLSLGADVVVHSATKYINGHSDAILGLIVAKKPELIQKMRFMQNAHGAVPSAFDCWLVQRGLKTLDLRMMRHGTNALQIAQYLRDVAQKQLGWVTRVGYLGLGGNDDEDCAHKDGRRDQAAFLRSKAWSQIPPETQSKLSQMGYGPKEGGLTRAEQGRGFPYGGMVNFSISAKCFDQSKGHSANQLFKNLRLFSLAESLGGVESLIELPSQMTHASIPVEARERLGIDDYLIRISVGIEDPIDLIKDLRQALGRTILGEEGWSKMTKKNESIY